MRVEWEALKLAIRQRECFPGVCARSLELAGVE
jgi:hypothetical protein